MATLRFCVGGICLTSMVLLSMGTVGTFDGVKCRSQAGGNCTCSGLDCNNADPRLGYTAITCVEFAHMQCVAQGATEECTCTYSDNQTETKCKTITYWDGDCSNPPNSLGNVVDNIDVFIDECDSSFCNSGS